MSWNVGITMLECGCVYSAQSLTQNGNPPIPECWYCKKIANDEGTTSCWDYKVHRGFLYNPKTGKVTTRDKRNQKGRYT